MPTCHAPHSARRPDAWSDVPRGIPRRTANPDLATAPVTCVAPQDPFRRESRQWRSVDPVRRRLAACERRCPARPHRRAFDRLCQPAKERGDTLLTVSLGVGLGEVLRGPGVSALLHKRTVRPPQGRAIPSNDRLSVRTGACAAGVPELERLARTIEAWSDQLLAYFTTGRASNGPTEAVNLLIKTIKGSASDSGTSATTGSGCSSTAASPGTLPPQHDSEGAHHAWRRRTALLGESAIQPREDVLDIGCGSGGPTRAAAQLGRSAVGVDISRAQIDQALQMSAGDDHVQFVCADAEHLGANIQADVVISQLGVMFFRDPVSAFNRLRRCHLAVCRGAI